MRIRRVPIDRLEPVVVYLDDNEESLRESDVEDLVSWLWERKSLSLLARVKFPVRAATIDALNKVAGLDFSSVADRNRLRSRIFREILLQVFEMGGINEV